MVDQMGKDFAPLMLLCMGGILGIIIACFIPEWYTKHKRRKAHKLYRMAQNLERKEPDIIRFYRHGTYHVTKAISEEELEEIEQEENTPDLKYESQLFMPIFLGILNKMEEQEDFEGVAESAIKIVNEEWANRNDDGQVKAQ